MKSEASVTYSAVGVLRRLLHVSRAYVPWYLGLCALTVASAVVGLGTTQAYRLISNAAVGGSCCC